MILNYQNKRCLNIASHTAYLLFDLLKLPTWFIDNPFKKIIKVRHQRYVVQLVLVRKVSYAKIVHKNNAFIFHQTLIEISKFI